MKKSILPYAVIYTLTIIDVLLTYTGLCTGFIEEANPILKCLIRHSLPFTMLGILVFVAGILYFLYRISSKIKWISSALTGMIGIKFGVLILHAVWVFAI